LRVRENDGFELEVVFVIDTGFNSFVTLPRALILQVGLLPTGYSQAKSDDEQQVQLPVFEAVVEWDGNPKAVVVLQVEGSPLLGMALLAGFNLNLDVVEGGSVTIRPIRRGV